MAEIYNNPGNIQIGQGFAGTVGEYASDREGEGKKPFVEFDSPQMGLRAIYRDLQSKVNTFDGDVAKIISKYAPGNENKTQAYIDNVIKQIGSDTITADNIDEAVRAIVRHENGTNSETTKYYLDDPNLLKEAKELAKHNMPAAMTYKKAAETYLPKKEIVTEAPTVKQAPSINPLEQYMRGAETESQYGKGTEKQSNLSNYEKAQNMVAGGNDNIIAGLMQSNYANQNLSNTQKNLGTVELPPDQTITPYRETIKEDVTVRPDQIRVNEDIQLTSIPNEAYQYPVDDQQERARRSMMQGNRQDRMEDYQYSKEYQEDYPYLYPRNTGSYALPQQQAAQRMMGGGMGYAEGGSVNQAEGIASLGRGGDSTLVHMQPQEVAGLQQIAQANGTSLTTNPMTGMPEAFSLGGMFKAAAPIAAGYFTGGASFGAMGMGAGIAAGAATGAGIAAMSGDDVLAGGLSGGLGGYSGFGLESALMGPGLETIGGSAIGNAVPYASGTVMPAASTTSLGGMTNMVGHVATPATTAAIGANTPIGLNSATSGAFGGPSSSLTGTDLASGLDANVGGASGGYNTATKSFAPPPKIEPGNVFNRPEGVSFLDTMKANLEVPEMAGTTNYLGGERMMESTGKMIPGDTLDVAMALGAPAASLGMGGLEVSDFYDDDIDFSKSDPRDKYNPYSKLNLNTDTGIKESLAADTGLRLFAEGGRVADPGAINLNSRTQGPSGQGLNLTRGVGSLNLNTGAMSQSANARAAQAIKDAKPKALPLTYQQIQTGAPRDAILAGPLQNYDRLIDGSYRKRYAEGGRVADPGAINLNSRTQGPSGQGLNLGRGAGSLNVNTGAMGQSANAVAEAARLKAIEDAKPKIRVGPSMSGSLPVQYYTGGIGGVGGGRPSRPTGWFGINQGREYAPGYAEGGYLQGPGDGMSDNIPATINGEQPAALADGEFVVPADVVSHLGNGSSEAGSKQLYAMMDRIRKARTGRKSQGKEIKPKKYMPV